MTFLIIDNKSLPLMRADFPVSGENVCEADKRGLEVAKRSFDGGREKCFTVLSPSFPIAQQPPRQRGPWVGIIYTPMCW